MIVCFDTETTGISLTNDELLQITIVDENEKILLESYIKPVFRTSWINAEKVNHINPQMVENAPLAKDLLPKIKEIFDAADAIVGYNTGFDVGFVEKCTGYKFDKEKIVDCLKIFRDECKKKKIDLPHHKLGNAIDYYCPEAKEDYLKNAHDASCDAIATIRVYLSQLEDKERNVTPMKISDKANDLINSIIKTEPKEDIDHEI